MVDSWSALYSSITHKTDDLYLPIKPKGVNTMRTLNLTQFEAELPQEYVTPKYPILNKYKYVVINKDGSSHPLHIYTTSLIRAIRIARKLVEVFNAMVFVYDDNETPFRVIFRVWRVAPTPDASIQAMTTDEIKLREKYYWSNVYDYRICKI